MHIGIARALYNVLVDLLIDTLEEDDNRDPDKIGVAHGLPIKEGTGLLLQHGSHILEDDGGGILALVASFELLKLVTGHAHHCLAVGHPVLDTRRVEQVAGHAGADEAAACGKHARGHDFLDAGEVRRVEMNRRRRMVLLNLVGDGARLHDVFAVGKLHGRQRVRPALGVRLDVALERGLDIRVLSLFYISGVALNGRDQKPSQDY